MGRLNRRACALHLENGYWCSGKAQEKAGEEA
jgi:hypothetical protein